MDQSGIVTVDDDSQLSGQWSSGTTRRSRHPNQSANISQNTSPYGSYAGFNVDPQPYGYSDQPMYDPSAGQPFGDMSGQQLGGPATYDPYMNSGQPLPGQMYAPTAANAAAMFNVNQQMFFAAGQQFINSDAAAQMVDQYGKNLVNKGKSWVGANLKYYFAVDTSYVLKKLLLIFFPFTHKVSSDYNLFKVNYDMHKDWSSRYNPSETVAPRDDLNSPDLYIPTMAFVTYILVSGYLLGIQERFSPEVLGIQASTALAWLLIEVVLILMALYLLSISCSLGFFHLIAFGGYKFVWFVSTVQYSKTLQISSSSIVGLLLVTMPFTQLVYYLTLGYFSLSFGYFLLRSLHFAIQSTSSPTAGNGLYLVLIICLMQPFVMYFLTRNFTNSSNL